MENQKKAEIKKIGFEGERKMEYSKRTAALYSKGRNLWTLSQYLSLYTEMNFTKCIIMLTYIQKKLSKMF